MIKIVNNKVIATTVIPANYPVLEFKGDLFDKLQHSHDKVLQININKFLGPSGSVDDIVRHSCNPNCSLYIIGRRAFLYSMYVITTNSEVTFDYSTSSTATLEEWQMKCYCNSYNCRKIISGYSSLPEDVKNKYDQLGIVPDFVKKI